MNIPTLFGRGSAASTDYQSLYAAPSAKNTFAQTLAETQSSWLSLTTAEGDRVTLSDLSMSYQQTQGVGWVTPVSSGMNVSSSSMTAEAMGLSVQGDLNAQELADINRLVGELTSIASTFFSGDYEAAMTKAMDFGDLGLGSVSSLAAAFSSQTVSQTTVTSQSSLPAMADLEDLYKQLEADRTKARDYAALLEARWQQILKTLDEKKKEELDGLFARRMEPLPVVAQGLNAGGAAAPASPEEPPASASEPPAVLREAKAADLPAVPASEEATRQMLAHQEQPFADALAATAMEKAASRAEQPRPDTAPRTVA